MYTALVIFISVFLICFAVIWLLLTFWLAQFIIERFIEITLPILVDLYGRWRYPEQFKE